MTVVCLWACVCEWVRAYVIDGKRGFRPRGFHPRPKGFHPRGIDTTDHLSQGH